jgi:uroporphyrinogen III methyltransferase / synthase
MTSELAPVLRGKRVVIACSEEKAQVLSPGLAQMGAEVAVLPVVSIRPIPQSEAIRKALDEISSYDWILFTSGHGVRFFSRHLFQSGIQPSDLPPVCAIGPATAVAARKHGYRVELIPEQFIAEGVLRALIARYGGVDRLAGTRFLLPRAKEGREVLPKELEKSGATVDVVPCYETVPGEITEEIRRDLGDRAPDLLVFTSASTVRTFALLLGSNCPGKVAALGPVTAEAAVSVFGKCDIVPDEATIPSLLDAIRIFYSG